MPSIDGPNWESEMKAAREIETIQASNLHAQLSGAYKAEIFGTGSPRVVRLTYLDGETEEAYLTIAEIAAGKENWFCMVGAVQGTRRDTFSKVST